MMNESFANGTSSIYFEQMYEQWQADPDSVHASWRAYFQNIEAGVADPYTAPSTLGQTESKGGASDG
jgi:2-oxoglutarate dehydrogenase E1 component